MTKLSLNKIKKSITEKPNKIKGSTTFRTYIITGHILTTMLGLQFYFSYTQ